MIIEGGGCFNPTDQHDIEGCKARQLHRFSLWKYDWHK